jgi:hypothetical protein
MMQATTEFWIEEYATNGVDWYTADAKHPRGNRITEAEKLGEWRYKAAVVQALTHYLENGHTAALRIIDDGNEVRLLDTLSQVQESTYQGAIMTTSVSTRREQEVGSDENLTLITNVNHGALWSMVDKRWGELGATNRGLRFHPSGMIRLGQIMGWIEGVSYTDRDRAIWLANCLCGKLDYLNSYGGFADGKWAPKYITVMYDEGTFNSFNFVSYIAWDEQEMKDKYQLHINSDSRLLDIMRHQFLLPMVDSWKPYTCPPLASPQEKTFVYKRNWNGGLNYHHTPLEQEFNPRNSCWSVNS